MGLDFLSMYDILGYPFTLFGDFEMRDKDKAAKERLRAWRALPVEGRISWEGFKRQWAMMSDEQRKAAK